MKLSCHDQSDNNVIDHIGLVYIEIETELSRAIWLGAVYDENQIKQRWDQWYGCGLYRKQNCAVVTDWTVYDLW